MDTPDISGYSRGKVMDTPGISGYSRGGMMDTPDSSGYSRGEVMDTSDSSGYSRGEMMDTPNVFGYSRGEVMDTPDSSGYSRGDVMETPDISGYSRGEVKDTPDISGYSSGEVMDTPDISGYSRGEVMDTPNVSGHSRGELLEGQCEDTDPREMTAEGSRTLSHSVNTQLHLLDSHNSAFPGRVIKIQPQEKEEKEMLKEKIKKLEARNQELLAKAMAMHQRSEDINDPSRLSAVLERYEMLRLREWEKVRSSISHGWTYEQGSHIIKKLFDACEKDIQQRTADILKVLDMPPLNDALTKSKQMMMREIRNLFRQLYYQNYSTVYSKIVKEAAIQIRTEIQREFVLQCCQIYCLLLLQDPPVKAEWNTERSLTQYLEHMDKEDAVFWKKPRLLWPIMNCGEEIIVKGVVWDESSMP